jgi:hypothetical protein
VTLPERGVNVLVQGDRTVAVAPATEYALVERAAVAPSGFPGDFVEARRGPADVSSATTSPSRRVPTAPGW